MHYDDLPASKREILDRADDAYELYELKGQKRKGEIIRHAYQKAVLEGNTDYLKAIDCMKQVPVTIDEFIESEEFLGASKGEIVLWPSLKEDLRAMHPDHMLGASPILEVILGGATGCVDGETEYLSPRGWVKIKDYPKRTKVAQFHPGGTISFTRPVDFIEKRCEHFYHFTGDGVDQMLSPEHRVYYKIGDEYKIESAEKVAEKVAAGTFKGKFLTTFDYKAEGLDSKLYMFKATMMCILRGSFVGFSNMCFLKDLKNKERTIDILEKSKVEYRQLENGWLYIQAPTLNQELPETLLEATEIQLEVLMEEVYESYDTDEGIIVDSEMNAGIIQYALCRLGQRSTCDLINGKYIIKECIDDYTYPLAVTLVKSSKYDPYKYCFEVPTSLLLFRRNGKIFISGNTGKSFLVSISMAYSLYYLTCFNRPQRLFNLDKTTPLVCILQSVKESVTRKVLYKPIRQMFIEMPYTKRRLKWNKNKEHELELEDNVIMLPAVADTDSQIGQAIIAAAVDEINFLALIENSRQVAGADGRGGLYNQADILYRTLTNRRMSRCITRGPNPGGIYLSSSVHYQDDFLEQRIAEVDPIKDTHVKVIKRKQYEAQPPEKYCGERFSYLVSSNIHPAKILTPDDVAGKDYPESGLILDIPIEYEEKFRNDPENAQRDILGIASGAINRFMYNTDKVNACMDRYKARGIKAWVHKQNVHAKDGMPEIIPENLPADKHVPRFVHIDLSISKDRCGIAVCKVNRYEKRRTDEGLIETVPIIDVELVMTITPSTIHHIDIADVRRWILELREVHGLNIAKVSYDQFNSAESRQMWRKAGVPAELLSVDKHIQHYEDLRRMIYEDRVDIIPNNILFEELVSLEKNEAKNKVDHRAKSSKDASDAVCGCIALALKNRRVRSGVAISTDSTPIEDEEPIAPVNTSLIVDSTERRVAVRRKGPSR